MTRIFAFSFPDIAARVRQRCGGLWAQGRSLVAAAGQRIRGSFALALFTTFVAVASLGALIPRPAVLSAFEGQTEFLRYHPVSGQGEAFSLGSVTRVDLDSGARTCLADAELFLSQGALELAVDPAGSGSVSVATTPGSKYQFGGTAPPATGDSSAPLLLLLGPSPQGPACGNADTIRKLTLRGNISIGREGEDATGELITGGLRIFGRIEPSWLSWLHDLGPGDGSAVLFEAAEIDLPRGVRVASFDEADGVNPSDAGISGTVTIVPAARQLDVAFQTSKDALYVWPRDGSARDRPDKYMMTLSTRLGGDPYFQWLVGILSAVALITGIWVQLWSGRK